MVVVNPLPLLTAFLFTQHCFAQELPCDIPNDAEGSFSFKLRDNKLFYFCLNETKVLKVSTCLKGKWKPKVEENCLASIQQHLLLKPSDYSRSRFRRSPHVGKFESLKRREKVQRKIKNGQLVTKMEHNTPTIVRVHPGNRAFLLCRIENLGTNSVLWSKQGRVLSIDTLRIADDIRFLPSHDEATRTWTLEVKGIRPTDEGDYVCQVNTRPPLKHFVSLQVIPVGVPLLPPVTQSMSKSRIDEMDEMRANISAIWSEINRIGEMVSTHVQDGHHHHDSNRHEVGYNQHHHHNHGNETQDMSDQIHDHGNHTHETEHHHDDQHNHQDHPHDDLVNDHHHHDEQRGHHHQHVGESGHHHHYDEQTGHHHHHDEQRGHHHQHVGKSDHHHHQDKHYHHSNHTHETEHHHDDQHYHQDHPHDDHVDYHHHHDEQRGHHHQHSGESGHHHHHDERRGHHHHHDDSHEVGSHDGDQVPHVHKPQSHEDNSEEEESKGNNP